MQQRDPGSSDSGRILPHAAAFAGSPGPAIVTVDDDPDDDVSASDTDDDGPARPARIDPRLLDPDVIERARRVEIYRRLIEADPQTSLFTRPESPPKRAVPTPRVI